MGISGGSGGMSGLLLTRAGTVSQTSGGGSPDPDPGGGPVPQVEYLPVSVASNPGGVWKATADILSVLSDDDDYTYAYSGANTSILLMGLPSTIPDPGTDTTPHVVTFRALMNGAVATCGFYLYQGSIAVSTRNMSVPLNFVMSITWTLTQTEVASITDYSQLRLGCSGVTDASKGYFIVNRESLTIGDPA